MIHRPGVLGTWRVSRSSHLSVGLVAVAVLTLASMSFARQTSPPDPGDGPGSETQVQRGEESGRGRGIGIEGRPRGRGRGPGSEADFERMIAVVEDISPEWASSLRMRLSEDPDAAREDFRRHGRRLFGLVMLKERNPRLYVVRVAELALKKGMKETAIEYHRVLAEDPSLAESIAGRLREMAAESVDLELRARAMELEALDQAVRELREKLLGEVADRQSRIDSVWKSLIENDPSFSEEDLLEDLPAGPAERGSAPATAGADRS